MRLYKPLASLAVLALTGAIQAAIPAPIAYFPLDTITGGGTTPDLSGFGNDGTVVGATQVAGPPGHGNALEFISTGSEDRYVGVSSGLGPVNGGTAVSISFWAEGESMMLNEGANNYLPFFAFDNDGAAIRSGMSITWQGADANGFHTILWDSPTAALRMLPSPHLNSTVTVGLWNQYLFTTDYSAGGNFMNMYINGVLFAQGRDGPLPSGAFESLSNYRIGANADSSRQWGGALDDFAIWNVQLDADQALELYLNGPLGQVPEPASLLLLATGGLLILQRRSASR